MSNGHSNPEQFDAQLQAELTIAYTDPDYLRAMESQFRDEANRSHAHCEANNPFGSCYTCAADDLLMAARKAGRETSRSFAHGYDGLVEASIDGLNDYIDRNRVAVSKFRLHDQVSMAYMADFWTETARAFNVA